MKNKGFTLVELLAVIIIMGLLATIIFPMVNTSLSNSKDSSLNVLKSNIIDATKDWSLDNLNSLPENGSSVNVKLDKIKQGYLPLNVKNPKTGYIISNESYVTITNVNGKYKYEVYIYDIPDSILDDDAIVFTGNFLTEELSKNSNIDTYDILVKTKDGNSLNYSKQYILNDAEVDGIDTTTSNIYSIVYTVLYNNNIYKAVKTIIIK